MAVKHTIKLKKYLDVIWEFVANAAIEPGMLVELMSTNKVRAHADANGNAIPMFALEDELQGKGIHDAYAAGDPVQVWVAQRGEKVYALLEDGQAVVIGDFLVSAGNGHLRKFVGGDSGAAEELPMEIVAMALEAVDASQSSGGDFPQRHIEVMVV
jgi:hypothetical protein